MDGSLLIADRSASPGILFAEDFDDSASGESTGGSTVQELAPDPTEPEVIEPVFSESELRAACQAAREAGLREGLQQANAANEQKIAAAMAAIADALTDAQRAAKDLATDAADCLARTVLAALSAALPRFCARYGEAEVQGLIAALLPSLDDEPVVTIRVQPAIRDAVQDYVRSVVSEKSDSITVVADETLSHGDVRVEWRNGQARRDTGLILSEIGKVLNAQGLLDDGAAGGETEHAG
jgi:hypothetical protein